MKSIFPCPQSFCAQTGKFWYLFAQKVTSWGWVKLITKAFRVHVSVGRDGLFLTFAQCKKLCHLESWLVNFLETSAVNTNFSRLRNLSYFSRLLIKFSMGSLWPQQFMLVEYLQLACVSSTAVSVRWSGWLPTRMLHHRCRSCLTTVCRRNTIIGYL